MYCTFYSHLFSYNFSFKAFAGLQGVKRGQHNFVLEAAAGLLSIVQWTFMLILPLIQVRYTLYKHVCMYVTPRRPRYPTLWTLWAILFTNKSCPIAHCLMIIV